MVVVGHNDRMTGLSSDSKPTANIVNNTMFEETDTGKWFRFDLPSLTWILMGQDNRGAIHSNPAVGYNFNPDASLGNAYMIFNSTTPLPSNPLIPIGVRALDSDAQSWYKWTGTQWIPTALPSNTTTINTAADKGGGTATFSGNGSITVFAINHNLGVTPTVFGVSPGTAAAWASHAVTADANSVIVTYTVAPANSANNIVLRWWARP